MVHRAGLTAAALVVLLAWAGDATAGWAVEQLLKSSTETARQRMVVQSNRIKTMTFDPSGQPVAAFILDLGTETLIQVDYQQRQYVAATFQEYVTGMAGAAQAAARQMADSLRAMQEATKNMPPEQRKAVEQSMRSQMPPSGAPGSADCVEPKREVRKTGQQATIAGFPAVRYEVLADGKIESEVWVAPGLGVGRELDTRKLEQFSTSVAKAVGCAPGAPAPGADPAWKLVGEGYPVRTIVTGPDRVIVEVVKAESRAIPVAEFLPPAGFAPRTLRQMMGQ